MKSEYQIYMDFQAAETQVTNLHYAARYIRDLADSDMENTLRNISTNWSGENADAYIAKAQQLQSKIRKNADDIEHIAAAIHTIAENTRKAEERAIRIAGNEGKKG